ncbi:glycosyl transferase, partial [Candidatus Curtissbacteria bacterium RBG_13_35_7]
SIISPVYNEEKNLEILFEKLHVELDKITTSWEIIFVNDGSLDNSSKVLHKLSHKNSAVKIIEFTRNYGQTAALMAGFEYASGEIIITIDSDLQNDPKDIKLLVKKLNEGYDVVSGWRKNRKDNVLIRTFPSKLANILISKVAGVKLHDYGCTLKGYRSDVLKNIKLYGEMHRFIPLYVNNYPASKVTEIPISHYRRLHGKSKYGISRIFKVILDLTVVEFLSKYSQKPIYIFGAFGISSFFLSIIAFLLTLYFKFFGGKSFIQTPLPLLVVLFFLVGFQSILMGLISEMLTRTYYESQGKKIYVIKNLLNIKKDKK